MNIALVGSRKVPVSDSVRDVIARILADMRPGDSLLVRSPDGEAATSEFEAAAAALASSCDINISFFSPAGKTRDATFRRDYDLVLAADEVLAYFHDSEIDGGTWHVVHAAMQKGVCCRAFAITPDGRTELIGSEDGPSPWDSYGYNG